MEEMTLLIGKVRLVTIENVCGLLLLILSHASRRRRAAHAGLFHVPCHAM